MKTKRIVFFFLYFLCISFMAEANPISGYPFDSAMMREMHFICRMLFGNLFIGIVEGFLLGEVFHLDKIRCILLMIVANYFSAWMGWSVLGRNAMSGMGIAVTTYLLALLWEFPFVAFLFVRDKAWFSKAIRGSLLVQTASYACILLWYGLTILPDPVV
jgi:hypothetical protein